MKICINTNCPFYRDCDRPEMCEDRIEYSLGNNISYVNYTVPVSLKEAI